MKHPHQNEFIKHLILWVLLSLSQTSYGEYYFYGPHRVYKDDIQTMSYHSQANHHKLRHKIHHYRHHHNRHHHSHHYRQHYWVRETRIDLQFQSVHRLRHYRDYDPDMTTGDDNPAIHPAMNIDY